MFRNYSSYELFKEVLMNKYVPDNTQIIMISELEELIFLSSKVPDKVNVGWRLPFHRYTYLNVPI